MAEMDEVLEKIKEKSKQEDAESRKPKMLRKKGAIQTTTDAVIGAGTVKGAALTTGMSDISPEAGSPGKVREC